MWHLVLVLYFFSYQISYAFSIRYVIFFLLPNKLHILH